jgi:hypothetical protein
LPFGTFLNEGIERKIARNRHGRQLRSQRSFVKDSKSATGGVLLGYARVSKGDEQSIRERTSAGIAAARAEGRIGGRRKKLDAAKRREIAESVITGRKSGAEMARLYNISQPTVSRIVAQHRVVSP